MADEKGRIRTPISPARWNADEAEPEIQPGVISPDPVKEPEPDVTKEPVKEPEPAKKK